MELRALTTPDELQQVYALEREIWGEESADDCVPVLLLQVSARIGGLVTGAFDGTRLVGFAYALPAVRNGRTYLWSHMLGVAREYRNRGLAWRLKVEQRRQALEAGLDLIAWTYDPLQAANAHLNFAKLGVVVSEYHLDAYPGSASPLHAGTPTDRFIADWWLSSPRVVARLEDAAGGTPAPQGSRDGAGRRQVAADPRGAADPCGAGVPPAAPSVNSVTEGKDWLVPDRVDLSSDEPRLAVTIPTGFTEMQQRDLPLARAWRSTTREIFTSYLARGYQVTEFVLDRPARRGTYLMDR